MNDLNYLSEQLNPPQIEAVKHTEGPLLILAGAGSGKTRTLIYRIWYLIEEKRVNPWNILAVTFTNKAASEMRNRLQSLLPRTDSMNVWVSTFHSACVKILRQHISRLGMSNSFAILDGNDQLRIVKKCIKEVDDSPESLHHLAVIKEIRQSKNELNTAQEYKGLMRENYYGLRIADVFLHYERKLRENASLDFDDLLFFVWKLFKEHPDVLDYYQNRCRYILVDEYQDTNHAQSQIIYLLAEKHQNICVVGDDDQSIYRWRGADIHNILDFEKVYPQAKTIYLEQNYRSTQVILKAANQVISLNQMRKEKELWTDNEEGDKIIFFEAFNEQMESKYISQKIQSFYRGDFSHYNDFAALYRTNAQARAIEEALRNDGLSYRIVGGLKFYERKEIKDLIAYLKVVVNPDNQLNLLRIINVPHRKIGQATIAKIEAFADEQHLSLYQGIIAMFEAEELTTGSKKGLSHFIDSLHKWREFSKDHKISSLLEVMIEDTDYMEYLAKEKTEQAESRIENVKELLAGIRYFEKQNEGKTLEDYLDYVSLFTDIDEYEKGADTITLMTVHSAKGLEFPVVFMAGMEKDLFPLGRNSINISDLEEERRLFYVAMTRAQKRLFLTRAKKRNIFGSSKDTSCSPFIEEVPSQYLTRDTGKSDSQGAYEIFDYRAKRPRESTQRDLKKASFFQFPESTSEGNIQEILRAGDRVYHEKWGEGLVLYKEGQGENTKISINFGGLKKKLMIKYARLRKIG